jgi:hypothetical protein
MHRITTLLLTLALVARAVPAQVTETPRPFDSRGRYSTVTPDMALRAGLGPPEWLVSGDYREALLYQLASGDYVIAVTRRDLTVERYQASAAHVGAIRAKVDALPPQFPLRSDGRSPSRFVRHQTFMGFLVYGPALGAAITDETTGFAATYLLTAGASFFAATNLAKHTQITPERYSLSTHMSVRGAFAAGALMYALDALQDASAAGVLAGGLGGTAAGLILGKHWPMQEVVASELGADFFGLASLGVAQIVRGDREESRFLTRGEAAVTVGMAISGYALGKAYGASAAHNITPGDGGALWVTAGLGAMAGSVAYAGRDVGRRTSATALTTGAILGVAAGELLLSRRFDLEPSDASLMGLGSGAGALIGLGVARLIDEDGVTDTRTMTFSTLGGMAGLVLTHFLLAPPLDGGRQSGVAIPGGAASGLQFNPSGLALTAAGVPGKFPVLKLNFD